MIDFKNIILKHLKIYNFFFSSCSGHRKILVKNPDGTTKIIQQTIPPAKVVQAASSSTSISSASSSVSSSDATGGAAAAVASSSSGVSSAPSPGAQKVQIIRGPDGKVSVRGLNPGQQLIQMSDGKLHVLTTNQSGGQTKTVLKSNAPTTPKSVVSTSGGGVATTVIKAAVTPQQSPMTTGTKTPIVVRQQIAKAATVVTSAAALSPATTNRTMVTPKTQKRVSNLFCF